MLRLVKVTDKALKRNLTYTFAYLVCLERLRKAFKSKDNGGRSDPMITISEWDELVNIPNGQLQLHLLNNFTTFGNQSFDSSKKVLQKASHQSKLLNFELVVILILSGYKLSLKEVSEGLSLPHYDVAERYSMLGCKKDGDAISLETYTEYVPPAKSNKRRKKN